ncbi:anti-phage-associated DUF3780 domain-containing protein [Leptolyngbya sp. GGD]|uniref:anti-phage-associated DUF3780 domain-containing protein n=1 Tax=Leptolyngbya sp. GGD TaxID=2997907 RepID=UPI00227A4181|nr:anti-phage-associated DUF3780 domain-containing protein [Leptolyngbya sp. GGD]MCY6494532.1 DUF3780 domain-containing protein [Leptolyngbya sp. GGD]
MALAAVQMRDMGNERKRGPAIKPAHATQGFGVPLTIAPHHFVVVIPRGSRQPVQITEDLGMHAQGDATDVLDRVIISRPVWNEIATPVKRTFNERLKAHNLKPGQWKVGENLVDRLLGKELCVLAWAIEDLDPDRVGTALRNWLALRPEERWWLFGMTASTVGGLNDRGRGWRMALRYALGDTPQATIQEPRRGGKKLDESIYATLPLFQREES